MKEKERKTERESRKKSAEEENLSKNDSNEKNAVS